MEYRLAIIAFACLFRASQVFGARPELVEPAEGAIMPTLTESQRAFVAMAPLARRVKMSDPLFRAREMGLPAERTAGAAPRRTFWPKTVKLAWKPVDSAVSVKVVDMLTGKAVYESQTTGSFVYVDNLENAAEYEWTVSAGSDSSSRTFKTGDLPLRLLRFTGVNNVRDIGGKTGFDGRRIRQGLVFRAASLDGVKDAGHLRDRFGIKSDIDLRATNECAASASPLGSEVRLFQCPSSSYGAILGKAGKEQFAKVFRVMLDEMNYPVVIHGEKGDDRTGTVAFILLGLLGCDADSMELDWEASAFRNRAPGWNYSLLDGLEKGLERFYGANSQRIELFEKYILDCGFSIDDIVKFRSIMLEK